MPKLCKDCKHVRRSFPYVLIGCGWEFAKCVGPYAVDLVSGKVGIYCSVARRNYCGIDAKHFEPKTPANEDKGGVR